MLRALSISALAVLCAVGVASCPAPDTGLPVPPAQPDVTPPPPETPPDEPVAEPGSGPAKPPAPETKPDGARCDQHADCTSGVCEGFGCELRQGVCAPAQRACTRDLRPYCGCDGETFRSSGSCPGGRYAYRGACADPRPDGEACASDLQCASGICEGQGCGPEETGRCVPTGRMCTADVREYCGCDGKTFTASGSCPGRRYAARDACK